MRHLLCSDVLKLKRLKSSNMFCKGFCGSIGLHREEMTERKGGTHVGNQTPDLSLCLTDSIYGVPASTLKYTLFLKYIFI